MALSALLLFAAAMRSDAMTVSYSGPVLKAEAGSEDLGSAPPQVRARLQVRQDFEPGKPYEIWAYKVAGATIFRRVDQHGFDDVQVDVTVSDGTRSVMPQDASVSDFTMRLAVDARGDVTGWDFNLVLADGGFISSGDRHDRVGASGTLLYTGTSQDAVPWTVARPETSTPLPSPNGLPILALGLGVLAFSCWRRIVVSRSPWRLSDRVPL